MMATNFVPAYIQALQETQQSQPNQNLANITNVLAAQKMDLPTAIGYALGKYALNRYQAWQDNKARDSILHPEEGSTDNSSLHLANGNTLDRNLMYGNQGNWAENALAQAANNPSPISNPAIQAGTSAGTTAIDSSLANAAQQTNQAPNLLGNLGKPEAQVAEKVSPVKQTLGLLGAADSLKNLANGTGTAGDLLNVGSHFFSDAASQDMSKAADVFQATLSNGLPNVQRNLVNQQAVNLSAPPATLDADGRQLANELIRYKTAWEVADKANDEKGRQEAAQGAKRIRSLAGGLGIDLSPYDANQTLGDAQAALALDNYRGVRHILNDDQTSEAYYNDVYDQLKQKGFGESTSRRIAAELAGRYQAGRLTRLENAFTEYGVDPSNNIMNNYGTAILMQMMREDPNAANGLAKMYGLPNVLTDLYQTTSKQNNQARNTILANSQNNAEHYRYGIATDNNRAENDRKLATLQGNIKMQEDAANNAARLKEIQAQAAARGAQGGSRGSRSGGGASGGSGGKAPSTADARAIIELADKWDAEHPDSTWANPYRDDADRAHQILDNAYGTSLSSYPDDIDDFHTAYSAGTAILENNAKKGYPASPWELEEMLKARIPKFADKLIEQWAADGTLARYGSNDY